MSVNKELKTTWNLSLLFKSDDAPEIEKSKKGQEKAVNDFVNKWEKRNDYLESPKALKEALDDYETLHGNYGIISKVAYYLHLKSLLNQLDTNIQAKLNQEIERITHLQNKIQFFELRLARIDKNKQQEFLNDVQLQLYRHFLERIFAMSPYLLSEDAEKVINLKVQPAHEFWVNMVSEFISKETRRVLNEKLEEKEASFEEIATLMNSTNKKVRDTAAKAFNEILQANVEVATKEINAILYNKKIDDTLRKVSRPDLMRHIEDDIDSSIVDTMLETVEKHIQIARDYYKLKAKLLGVKKLKYHERNVPYGDIDKDYSYDETVKLVLKTFTNIDDEFAGIVKRLIDNGQIDAFPKKGKLGGALCANSNKNDPIYVLLNHTNKLYDVQVIAHELGHAVHFELLKQTPLALNYDASLAIAEVPSTFTEDFVLDELRKTADEKMQLAILMTQLGNDVSTIFRQVSAYRFEQDLHNSFRKVGYLPKEQIGDIFQKHMANYMGDAVEQSEGSENWWVYWSHFRMFFYVYSYASSLLVSKALQRRVRQDKSFMKEFKKILSYGMSKSPKDTFKDVGIDLTDKNFWEQGLLDMQKDLTQAQDLAQSISN